MDNITISLNDLKIKMENIINKKLFIENLNGKNFITDENNSFKIYINDDGIIILNDGERVFWNIFNFLDEIDKKNICNSNSNNNNNNYNDENNLSILIKKNAFLFKDGMIPDSTEPTGICGLTPGVFSTGSYTDYGNGHNKNEIRFVNEGLAKSDESFSFDVYEINNCDFCDGDCDDEYINNDNVHYCCENFQDFKHGYGLEANYNCIIDNYLKEFKDNFVENGIHGDCFILFFESATYGDDGGHLCKYYKLHKCKNIKEFEEFNFNEFFKNLVEGRSNSHQNEEWAYNYIQKNFANENEIQEYFKKL